MERRRERTVSAREFEVKGMMEEITGWRGQNESQIVGEEKRSGRLVGAAETSKERAEWRGLQGKNLRKGKSGLSTTETEFGKYAGAALAKRKRNRAVSPEYQIMRGERKSRWARAAPWRERGGSEREHEEERLDSTVKEGRFQGVKGGKARRASLGAVEESLSG